MSPSAAAIEAARLRFRPILMTSLAFILGVLPLAHLDRRGRRRAPSVGTGVMGGMLAATFLAIFFVPLFFRSSSSAGCPSGARKAELLNEVEHAHHHAHQRAADARASAARREPNMPRLAAQYALPRSRWRSRWPAARRRRPRRPCSTCPSTAALPQVIAALERWWTLFDDPALDRLVDEALANNPTSQLAMRASSSRGPTCCSRMSTCTRA